MTRLPDAQRRSLRGSEVRSRLGCSTREQADEERSWANCSRFSQSTPTSPVIPPAQWKKWPQLKTSWPPLANLLLTVTIMHSSLHKTLAFPGKREQARDYQLSIRHYGPSHGYCCPRKKPLAPLHVLPSLRQFFCFACLRVRLSESCLPCS